MGVFYFLPLFATGLLFNLTGAEIRSEVKTFTRKIIKMSELEKEDQVVVKRQDEVVAQYFCNVIYVRDPSTAGRLEVQSDDLVLYMRNISNSDRFDAFKFGKSGKKPILENFTLDEEPPHVRTLLEILTERAVIVAVFVAVFTGIPEIVNIVKITGIIFAITAFAAIIIIIIIFWICKPVPKKQPGHGVELGTFQKLLPKATYKRGVQQASRREHNVVNTTALTA